MGRIRETKNGRVWWETKRKIGKGVFQENEKLS
jgi:hypothetical protein